MNVNVPSMAPGERTLPAEFVSNPHNGYSRLLAGARQFALSGLGDGDSADNLGYDLSTVGQYDTSTSGDTVVLPGGASYNPGDTSLTPLIGSPVPPVYISPSQTQALTSSGLTPAQIAQIVASGSSALNQALALSNGGSVTIGPNGMSQIIGSANSTVGSSLNNLGTSISSMSPLVLVAIAGALLLAFSGRK